MSEVLTLQDVADILKINIRTVRRLVKEGKFPHAFRINGSRKMLRIPREDVEALIESERDGQ